MSEPRSSPELVRDVDVDDDEPGPTNWSPSNVKQELGADDHISSGTTRETYFQHQKQQPKFYVTFNI